jgi:hypothetical protein
VKDERHAILAIDPGGTSGVFAAYADPRPTLKETLLEGLSKQKSTETKGGYLQQGARLATIIRRFVFVANVENSIAIPNISVVLEDFVLRRRQEGGATGNLTSCWVAAATMGAAGVTHYVGPDQGEWGVEVSEFMEEMTYYQQPSQAKGLATNERLKLWGLWTRGDGDHIRDAKRHFATRLNKVLD